MPLSANASRARGHWRTALTADGATVTVRLCGDEWCHYYQSSSGDLFLMGDNRRLVACTTAALAERRATAMLKSPAKAVSIGTYNTHWDSTRIYKVPVFLVQFSDQSFSMERPRETYDSLFNHPGFNKGRGMGCVADYFRAQSGGLLNLQFDIVDTIRTDYSASINNSGASLFRTVVSMADSEVDFSQYDWNGDGKVEQCVFVYAGYGANEDYAVNEKKIWPNTSSFSQITLDGVTVAKYSASAELWHNNRLCGIGTICHEFSHCLGLPDLYPTSSSSEEYSVLDEWDLMDGGNFTNDGWCPPNYSVFERMCLGWVKPEVLGSATTVSGMLPVSSGGKVYVIESGGSAGEYFTLENRQWDGWDTMLPGHGLLITHIDNVPSGNSVNNKADHHRVDFVHADNRSYDDWYNYFVEINKNPRLNGHNRILQNTPYPYIVDSLGIANDSLTNYSLPAATLFVPLPNGSTLLNKPLTHISEAADSTISFNFMGGDVIDAVSSREIEPDGYTASFDLAGRPAPRHHARPGIYIERNGRGARKIIVR